MVGKARSCTPCRQAKMACDAQRRAPGACTRCGAKGLQCRFDKNFKRIATRKIAQEIANEFHILRASQDPVSAPGQASAASTTAGGSTISPQQTLSEGDESSLGGPDEPLTPALLMTTEDNPSVPSFSIGAHAVASSVISELFRHFAQNYHPFANSLQPIKDLPDFATECPLLFWTIVLVASQYHPQHSGLYDDVYFPHRDLLEPISTRFIQRVDEIHALLLLCLWPIPRQEGHHDPTWNYLGIATNAAMKMSFHKPIVMAHDGTGWLNWASTPKSVNIQTVRLTWLACFNIGVGIATFLGFVPPISSPNQLRTVHKAAADLSGDGTSEQMVRIRLHEVICTYSIALEDIEDPPTCLALIKVFDSSLEGIKQENTACWTRYLDILFQYAKLNLYALAAMVPPRGWTAADAQVILEKEALLHAGLGPAMRLMTSIKELSLEGAGDVQRPSGMLTFVPRNYFTMMGFAATYLYRVFACRQSATPAQRTLAINGLVDAATIYRSIPNHRDAVKIARYMQGLIDRANTPTDGFDLGGFIINNRLGASMLWDTIMHNQRSRKKLLESVKRSMKMTEETELPLAPEMKTPFETPPLLPAEPQEFWPMEYATDFGFDFNQSIFW